MTTTTAHDTIYSSERLIEALACTVEAHSAVGDDFPHARPALLANLRTLQSALPAAIASVVAAMEDHDG